MRRSQIIGKKFNNLTVLEFAYIQQGNSYWKCVCGCDKECIVPAYRLKSGDVTSCGCIRTYKHGQGVSGLKVLYRTYKNNARNNNRAFDLTLEELKEITSKDCIYCGAEPEMQATSSWYNKDEKLRNHKIYTYNGIDRIDSSRGYEKDNIVPCCKWCNIAKGNKTVEEFKEHIFKMYNYLNSDRNSHEPALP